jgi:hypothetical protein
LDPAIRVLISIPIRDEAGRKEIEKALRMLGSSTLADIKDKALEQIKRSMIFPAKPLKEQIGERLREERLAGEEKFISIKEEAKRWAAEQAGTLKKPPQSGLD